MSSIAKAATAAIRPVRRNFLSDVVIDYGPRDVLSRLFLKADTELRSHGIQLSFEPPEVLLELNRQHRDSWRSLLPVFDAEIGGFNADNGLRHVGERLMDTFWPHLEQPAERTNTIDVAAIRQPWV